MSTHGWEVSSDEGGDGDTSGTFLLKLLFQLSFFLKIGDTDRGRGSLVGERGSRLSGSGSLLAWKVEARGTRPEDG